MKAVQIFARNHAELVTAPKPQLKPNHALIRPVCLSLCASDIYMLKYAPEDEYPYPAGTSGHEMVGVVEAIDGYHPEVAVGDLTLTIAPEQSAMAEYYVAPLNNVIPVPQDVSPAELVQAQQLGTVIYACKELPNMIGKSVAVVGQGSAGLWFNVMLKRLGADKIIGLDLLDHRLAVSKQFGATHTINNGKEDAETTLRAILDGELPDVVIEAVGEEDAINVCIDIVKDNGFMLQFGVPHGEQFTINYYTMFRKCLTHKSIVYASREPNHTSTRKALQMIASGEIDVRPILTHRFSLDDVLQAYALQHSREDGAIKIVVEVSDL